MPFIQVQQLKRAIDLYLQVAYPGNTVPLAVRERLLCLDNLPPEAEVPESCLEVTTCQDKKSYAIRLGQPIYPHMKIVLQESPGSGYLFCADAHDMHLHAPPGSPDAAWLAQLRAKNKELTEGIEAAWVAGGIPTFREYLRQELVRRRAGK